MAARSALGERVRELAAGLEPPRPVAERLAGRVHAALAAEPEHVLRRSQCRGAGRGERASSIRPRGSRLGEVAPERVGVVRRRVDRSWCSRSFFEPDGGCQRCLLARRIARGSPPSPGSRAHRGAAATSGVISAEVLRDHGRRGPSTPPTARTRLPRGRAGRSRGPCARPSRPRRDQPGSLSEAAEVVEPGQVEERRRRPPQALDPGQRQSPSPSRPRPSRTAGCPSAARAGPSGSGGAPPSTALEELVGSRMRQVVDAARGRRRSARRRSGRRPAARAYSRSAVHSRSNRHLVGDAAAGPLPPVLDPGRPLTFTERVALVAPSPARRAPARNAAPEQANADDDAYGEPTSSGGPSGSTCRQLWPCGFGRSTMRVRVRAEPARPVERRVQHRSPLDRSEASSVYELPLADKNSQRVPSPSSQTNSAAAFRSQDVRPQVDCGTIGPESR